MSTTQWTSGAAHGDLLETFLSVRIPGDDAALVAIAPLPEHLKGQGGPAAVAACYLVHGRKVRSVCVSDAKHAHPDMRDAFLGRGVDARQAFQAFVAGTHGAVFDTEEATELLPLPVPKPWGQEIWFTGIEKRGVCKARQRHGSAPLSWVIAALGKRMWTCDKAPLLLKVLDPSPTPVFGDLYYELHREKWETYVVSHVDPKAWPDGRGALKWGVSEKKLLSFGGDEDRFKDAFREAIKAYESARRKVDARIDVFRAEEKIGLNEPVDASVMARWLARLPADLRNEELRLRKEMDGFVGVRKLAVGDVAQVPVLVPHALQHGVRVVEFQTPTYERLIVSFAQKVLTQPHWDVDEAIRIMTLASPKETPLPVEEDSERARVERVVDFAQFRASRVRLAAGATCEEGGRDTYVLLYALSDGLVLRAGKVHHPLPMGSAWILPARSRFEVECLEGVGRGSGGRRDAFPGCYLRAFPRISEA